MSEVELTHIDLNDQTLEGLRHRNLPLFSVQYHPEASPGPHDSHYLFNDFVADDGGVEGKMTRRLIMKIAVLSFCLIFPQIVSACSYSTPEHSVGTRFSVQVRTNTDNG